MVHLAEQSFSSVEQVVCNEFHLTMEQSGYYGSVLRIPFGFGVFLTGMLADRMGASRVLTIYLTGTAVVCLSFMFTSSTQILAYQLFGLGVFASMYHPAGLSMMTSITTPQDRAKALGIHGVFGSLGLGGAPLLAGFILLIPNATWRTFFVVLGLLAAVFVFVSRWGNKRFYAHAVDHVSATVAGISEADQQRSRIFTPLNLQIRPFVILMLSSACSGIVYGGFLHFLKRYLSDVRSLDFLPINPDSIASVLAALVRFFVVSPGNGFPEASQVHVDWLPCCRWCIWRTCLCCFGFQ